MSVEYVQDVIPCVKCGSKAEIRYGSCPFPPFNTGLMCGKCASYLGVQLTDWVYPHPSVAEANPKPKTQQRN